MKLVTLLFFFIVTQTAFAAKCIPEMQQLQHNRHGYVEVVGPKVLVHSEINDVDMYCL